MSMLSGQADRLRKMAEWDGVDAVIASELRDAADTIMQLRDDMQRANAENAKLRELCADMLVYVAFPYVCVRPDVLVERARELRIEVDG